MKPLMSWVDAWLTSASSDLLTPCMAIVGVATGALIFRWLIRR